MEMICRFIDDEACPADCAHREPHSEIVDDDFGEHSPCVLANDCDHCSVPTYCVPSLADLLAELRLIVEGWDAIESNKIRTLSDWEKERREFARAALDTASGDERSENNEHL